MPPFMRRTGAGPSFIQGNRTGPKRPMQEYTTNLAGRAHDDTEPQRRWEGDMKKAKRLPIGVGEKILSGPWRPVDAPKTIEDRIPYGSSIYFVGGLGYIKIGYSADFRRRYAELAIAFPTPLEVIACIGVERDVGLRIEAAIHRELRQHQANGEWFIDCPAVRAKAIEGLQSGFIKPDSTRSAAGQLINSEVIWASDALKKIAEPKVGEPISKRLRRAADAVGISHTRAFDIWYRKARQISQPEMHRITLASGGGHA